MVETNAPNRRPLGSCSQLLSRFPGSGAGTFAGFRRCPVGKGLGETDDETEWEVNRLGDKSDRASGLMKEAAGKAKRDPDLQAKGRREQIKGDVKKSGKKLKDASKKL